MAKVKAKKSEIVVETKKDIKKREKQVKLQNKKEVSETETEVRRFVCILIVLLVVIGVFYFMASRGSKNTNTNEVVIQYDDISVGMILNRKEYSEYYVLAYSSDSENYTDLNRLYRIYRNRDNVTKLYTVNLSDSINKDFIATEGAKLNVDNAADFRFATDTLLYIKDGKVSKTYTTFKAIENVLK